MNVLSKISIKNLKLNKKRTISTIFGIILSCSLICAVAEMFTSFRETLIQNAINETGYYHIKLEDITENDVKTLENNRYIKEMFSTYEKGYAKLENGQNEDKPYLKLFSMDKKVFEDLKFDLIEGRFPTSENELIISRHIEDNGKVKYNIGDKIKINVGTRKSVDDVELHGSNPYQNDENLINTQLIEFTVVGIIKRPDYSFEEYSDPGYTVITTNINKGLKNLYITLKNPKAYKTVIPNILGSSNYNAIFRNKNSLNEELKYENFEINNELLRWEAFAFGDETVLMLYVVVSIVIFIIIFTSVFCIRNSIAIATTEKMKMYGMLASVGATAKQIKKNVIYEGFILGLIGIPLGVLSGIFAVYVLIKIVNVIAGSYLLSNVNGIVVKIKILPILISIFLSTITIYLSSISSAKKASKINPIELLRNADEIKIKSKKLKVPKIITKVFKTGGELAYKNLKRSKKKYRTTVISITVSIFVFITMNSFITNMFGFTSNHYKEYDYNVMLYCRGNTEDDVQKIINCSNIEEYFSLYQTKENLKIFDLSKINKINGLDYLSEDGYYDEETKRFIESEKGKRASMEIVALDDISFQKYAKKIGADYEEVKKDGILCDNIVSFENGKEYEIKRYKYEKNDIIEGILDEKEISFKVAYISKIKPYGIENSQYADGYLVLDLDEHKDLNLLPRYILVNSSNADQFIQDVKLLKINDLGYTNYEKIAKEEKAMILIVKIFLYGFITVITLIGVTNIFNTITSNMELRQKEFAMLKSVGMTKKEFNRMINLETIFYSSKSLIYGIFLGLIGTFILYKAFSIKIESTMYIPIIPIIISIFAVFILIFVIMKYSMSKIDKQNIIETIRNENI